MSHRDRPGGSNPCSPKPENRLKTSPDGTTSVLIPVTVLVFGTSTHTRNNHSFLAPIPRKQFGGWKLVSLIFYLDVSLRAQCIHCRHLPSCCMLECAMHLGPPSHLGTGSAGDGRPLMYTRAAFMSLLARECYLVMCVAY